MVDLQELDDSGLPIIGKKAEKKFLAIGQEPIVGANKDILLNKNVGDEVQITIDSENGNQTFKILIHSIERRIPPELNDEFAKKMAPDCNNIQEFKDKIKESMQKEYEKKSEEMFNSAVIDQFIKLVNPILPSSMFDSYLANIVNEVKSSPEGEKLEENQIREQYKTFAENNLKWFLLRKAIIEDFKLKIEEEKVDTFIADAIEKNKEQKSEIERFYKKESNKNKLSDDLLDEKILDLLKENTKVTDKDVETSELQNQHNQ